MPGGMLAAGANRAGSHASHLIANADDVNQNSQAGVLCFAGKLGLPSRWVSQARAIIHREASLQRGRPGGSPCLPARQEARLERRKLSVGSDRSNEATPRAQFKPA